MRITGVDGEPVIRRGDISSSGMFVQGEAGGGGCGTVELLQIVVPRKSERIDVLGRVVRRMILEDLHRGTHVVGAAFEFLFTDDETRERVARLVHEVAEREIDSGRMVAIQHAFEAEVGGADKQSRDAVVYVLGMDRLQLETEGALPMGETLECVVRSPRSDREFRFRGRVVGSLPTGDAGRHRVELRFDDMDADVEPSGASIDDALGVLLEESIRPEDYEPRPGRGDMIGRTCYVPLPSLLTLAEMDAMTGVLTLTGKAGSGAVYLRGGRIVDVELAGEPVEPRAALVEMIRWPGAEFRYVAGDVDRDDRVGAKTWVLLLELARRRDEGD